VSKLVNNSLSCGCEAGGSVFCGGDVSVVNHAVHNFFLFIVKLSITLSITQNRAKLVSLSCGNIKIHTFFL
jgi:hypothetical protein